MIEGIEKKLSSRVSWYDIYEVTGNSTPISYKNNRIHSINEKYNSGYGIRVNIDGKTGFSYSNDPENINDTIERAIAVASYGDVENFELPGKVNKSFEPYSEKIRNYDINDEIEKAEKAIDTILTRFPGANIDLGINCSQGTAYLINSRNIHEKFKQSYYSASISATYIIKEGLKIDVWDSLSSLHPVAIDKLNERIIERIEKGLTIHKLPAGKIPVILTPKAFSRLLGIVESGLNARSVWKGISPFAGKIGDKLFNEKLSLHDDPLQLDSPYSYPFDDEGVTAERKALISRGVISRYITDLKHAELLKITPEGNGSRGYASLPSPSYSNITIDQGTDSYDNILKNIKKGILVDQFIGLGQSNTLTGDFSANLDLAYLIEKGEITGRVKDCMISGNIFELLAGELQLSMELERVGATTCPYAMLPSVNFTG